MKLIRSLSVAILCSVTAATPVLADSSNKIKFRDRITLEVGQAIVVHGRRGDCGALPTKAVLAQSKQNLDANLKTGHIVFGKPGVRRSGGCGGWTPAYETIFVADRPGRETVKIHGDQVRITVK
ncbi:hypothetical protein [Cognatishimia sp. MH4019]|uniref:hypothetical protein n=1 Tax=Cognatishimia sp. MH4019 TaxID=2854030 RepID=UPI001CD31B51|nr:hypothetical protein [Cognatishimia sp. MH4019]